MPLAHPNLAASHRVKARYNFRPFHLTLIIIFAFATIGWVAHQGASHLRPTEYHARQRRAVEALEALDPTRFAKRDEECRLVHNADDKCAFIKANCPDEEAGLLSYLSLYYCSLPNAQPIAFICLTLWLGLLFTTIGIAASDFFCINLSTIASILGMSESMAGVTFLAFGNGSPDVFSTFAAMSSNSGSLAIGELIGAAGFITAVVAGSMSLVREFKVGKKTFVRDVGFFIVAASFSMVFLADGALHLWECCVMIAFYLFYVVIVVVWHWYLGRRRWRREREANARGHYLAVTNEEIEVSEEDGDDEDAPAGQGRYRDSEDFSVLERGLSPALEPVPEDDESDGDGEQGMRTAAEMASSMRVTRPSGSRRNTITPIRPSLVGALEFRSVLASLQKSRTSHTQPIHLRRYSDDTTALFDQNQSRSTEQSSESLFDNDSNILVTPIEAENSSHQTTSIRGRAVSMNDAAAPKLPNPAAYSLAEVPDIGIVAATPMFPPNLNSVLEDESQTNFASTTSPTSVTAPSLPGSSKDNSRDHSPLSIHNRHKQDTLTVPPGTHAGAPSLSPDFSPRMMPRSAQRPRLQIPSSSRDSSQSRTLSPIIPFPMYTDSPLPISSRSSKPPSFILPEPTITSDSVFIGTDEFEERRVKWWPYNILPSPYTLISTLFPTFMTWNEKSIWDKFVSIISAPSIFLLAITLPVVESESQNEAEEEPLPEDDRRPSAAKRRQSTAPVLVAGSPVLETDEPEWQRYRRSTVSRDHPHRGYSTHNTAAVAVSTENLHHHSHPAPIQPVTVPIDNSEPDLDAPKDWNRWLISVQLFTAPLFVVFIIWANSDSDDGSLLVRLILYSLLGSLVAFGVLVSTTSPDHPPKYRFLLCFLGFIVSIAWISTIANEVVGVLKAFGVILGISDAILGLTIFAVGNSLGDLVADITVARLGYPVMALSACFGGPMLNILLGIGIAGAYMNITNAAARHARHPGHPVTYHPYRIDIAPSLMVSGVTLLVTLVGLLIALPWNKWWMSRRIGWGLIVLWSVSTIINVALEVAGVFNDTTS